MSCSTGYEDLTIDNIVNPECGHSIWRGGLFRRWAKDKITVFKQIC